jgi:hypothetical protein
MSYNFGQVQMTKILPFVTVTKQSILREGKRELLRIYQMSAGGIDPVVDSKAWKYFEEGYIDEIPWRTFCELTFKMYMEED